MRSVQDLYARVRTLVRLVTALAITAALAGQMQLISARGTLTATTATNFFSYFTVESNVLAVVVLIALELSADSPLHRAGLGLRGAMTLYMSMTGIIYTVLLAPASADVGLTAKWVDTVVHALAPLIVFLDWFLAPPDERPLMRSVRVWVVFPIVYSVYSLIRGPIVDWYPYPFYDHRLHGTGRVVVSIVVLAVFVVGFALALVKLTPSSRRAAPA